MTSAFATASSCAGAWPARVITSSRAMRAPSASWAPRAMAGAALPTAATHTGSAAAATSPGSAASAARTQRRPSTRASAACRRCSSSSRRGSPESVSSAPVHDFELAAPAAPREPGRVRALELQPFQVLGCDITGDVHPREARGVELLDARILVPAGGDEVIEVLVDEPVGADERADLLDAAAGCHQLARRRHVDAVDVREAHRRCCRGEVHLGARRLRAPAR